MLANVVVIFIFLKIKSKVPENRSQSGKFKYKVSYGAAFEPLVRKKTSACIHSM